MIFDLAKETNKGKAQVVCSLTSLVESRGQNRTKKNREIKELEGLRCRECTDVVVSKAAEQEAVEQLGDVMMVLSLYYLSRPRNWVVIKLCIFGR